MNQLTPFLWFVDQAEEAAKFYVSVFKRSKIRKIWRNDFQYEELTGHEPGSVMSVDFQIVGQRFTAINCGQGLQNQNSVVSFVIRCKDQAEIDRYHERLTEGDEKRSLLSGWVKDRYGISWNIQPDFVRDLMDAADPDTARRMMDAMLGMKKMDIEAIKAAHMGQVPESAA